MIAAAPERAYPARISADWRRSCTNVAARELIRLYELWGRPEQAAKYAIAPDAGRPVFILNREKYVPTDADHARPER